MTGISTASIHLIAGLALLAWDAAAQAPRPLPETETSPTVATVPTLLDATARAEVAEALAQRLAASYAVAEAAERMAGAVRDKLAAGGYDQLQSPEEFARALQADVRAVVDDRHLRVTFDGARAASRAAPAVAGPGSPRPGPPTARDAAIGRLQILPGNIGYMEVSGVPPRANPAIDAAFGFLRNTDALIIDLRGNGGGDPNTVAYYMSYLSEGPPYTVMRMHDRQGGVFETTSTDLGDRSYGSTKPVYVLTSKYTFSGGEEFAYDVQAFKRGLVVGQTTGGGANPGGPQALGRGFTAFVPTGLAKHPVTGASWEGVGVQPDVPVEPALALLEAHRLAAEALASRASVEGKAEVLRMIAGGLAEQKQAAIAAKPVPASRVELGLVGRYAPTSGNGPSFSVVEQDGQLVLKPSGARPPSRLAPLGAGTYHLLGLPDDFTATFSATPASKHRLLLQQSNAMPPLLLEQQ